MGNKLIIKRYVYNNRKLICNDVLYDFSHLNPIKKQWNFEGKRVNVVFEFSTHTFSEKTDNLNLANILDKTRYFSNGNNRIFNKQRYNDTHSTLIPFIKNTIHGEWTIKKSDDRDDYIIVSKDYHIYIQIIPKSKFTKILITSAFRKLSAQGARSRKGKPETYKLIDKIL